MTPPRFGSFFFTDWRIMVGRRLVGNGAGNYQERENKRLDCRAARNEHHIAPAIMSTEELILVEVSSDAVSFLDESHLAAWGLALEAVMTTSVWFGSRTTSALFYVHLWGRGGSSARPFAWWTGSCNVWRMMVRLHECCTAHSSPNKGAP